ncbi:MAG: hypothetical protein Q7S92_06570 [Candidatus Diapherotrites archaeon]|nr:hypothetical protein [Candidatus Diapherotrites archaeon]
MISAKPKRIPKRKALQVRTLKSRPKGKRIIRIKIHEKAVQHAKEVLSWFALRQLGKEKAQAYFSNAENQERLNQAIVTGPILQRSIELMIQSKQAVQKRTWKRRVQSQINALFKQAEKPMKTFERDYYTQIMLETAEHIEKTIFDSDIHFQLMNLASAFSTVRHLPFLEPT